MSIEVVHKPELSRYDLLLDGETVGEAVYREQTDGWHFVHTEVDTSKQNQGLAGELMKQVFEQVRADGKHKVVPVCSYVVMYMKRHPETHDLLARDWDEIWAACEFRPRRG